MRTDPDVRGLTEGDLEDWEVIFRRSPFRTKLLGLLWGWLGVALVAAGGGVLYPLIKGWVTGDPLSVGSTVAILIFGLLLTIGGATLSERVNRFET